jgi:hypothetical protein
MKSSFAGAAPAPEDDASSCSLCKFAVSGDEVRVKMRFDDVLDLETMRVRFINVDVDISAWIDHSGFPVRSDEVRRMRQAAE